MNTDTHLTAEQVRDFHLQGYLRLEQFLTATELQIMRQVYDDWILTRKAGPKMHFGDLANEVPELRICRFRERAMAMARQLGGMETRVKGEKFMFRPAGHPVESPWHQDWAFASPEHISLGLTFWIPLQDTGIRQGCLWYLPASHLQDILPHRNRPDITPGYQKDVDLEADPACFDENEAVPMILPAGGVAIHHANTLHKACPNRSEEPRRACILSFGGPTHARLVPKGLAHWPWMEERSGDRGFPFDPVGPEGA